MPSSDRFCSNPPGVRLAGCAPGTGDTSVAFLQTMLSVRLMSRVQNWPLRIKIWDKDSGDAIVYDNQMGAGDDADPTTAIGGGSIEIHDGKK